MSDKGLRPQGQKRPNGQGAISFDGKRYIARYSYRQDGKLKRRQFAAMSYEAAEEWIEENSPTKTEWRPVQVVGPPCRTGEVYFVQGVDGGPIKIGWTTSIKLRFSSLQTGSPVRLRVIALIQGVERVVQSELHDIFEEFRLHGEWFEDAPALTEYIERLANVDHWWHALSDEIPAIETTNPSANGEDSRTPL